MKFKQYLDWCAAHLDPDSKVPSDIVQNLACLVASRLSNGGKLPLACGTGTDLDMDIVQAGLLAGLERIPEYNPELGTMRQFLYPTIAGAMANYAWERENRVGDSRPRTGPPLALSSYQSESYTESSEHPLLNEAIPDALIETRTPETLAIAEQDAKTALAGTRAAVDGLGSEGMAMLLRDAQIGRNAAKRQEWANELGVSLGALSVRLSRLRRDARDWALTVQ